MFSIFAPQAIKTVIDKKEGRIYRALMVANIATLGGLLNR
jgi:hypothetical protein